VDTGRAGIDTMTVTTDTNGNFIFSNVRSGTYTVCLEDTDALPDTSNLSRPLPKSKMVNVQDGIDVENIIFIFNPSDHVSFSFSNAMDGHTNNTTCDKELESISEGGSRPSLTSCLRIERIQSEMTGAEINREDRALAPRKGLGINNLINASTMSLDGLSLAPTYSAFDNSDDTDDDMSFHDDTTDTHSSNVSGAVYCDNEGTEIKGATLHLVDTGRAGIDTMTVTTDTNGNFIFSNVRSGTYTVCLEDTDALPDTSNLSRPLPKSKMVNVQDGIDVENIIFIFGPSVANKKLSNHVHFSLSNAIDGDGSNTTCDNELVAASEGGSRPLMTSCLRGEKIEAEAAEAELNREDRTLVPSTCDDAGTMKGLGIANSGTDPLCMHGLSFGPETWDYEHTEHLFNDDDDTSIDITQHNDSRPSHIYGASAMSMRGLSFGTEPLWEDAVGDDNDDDVSLDISLNKVFRPTPTHDDVLAGKRPGVADRSTSPSPLSMHGLSFGPETLAWNNADHLFHDATSDITQPEDCILAPICSNEVHTRKRPDMASLGISTMSTDGLLTGDDNDDYKSFHDETGIVLQKVSRPIHIYNDVLAGKRLSIDNRTTSPMDTLAWDDADHLFHDAASDITLPEDCILAPICNDVQDEKKPDTASSAMSTMSMTSTWEDATDGILNDNNSDDDKSSHDESTAASTCDDVGDVTRTLQTERKSEEVSLQSDTSHNEEKVVDEVKDSSWSLLNFNTLHIYSMIISVTAIVLLTTRTTRKR